MAWFPLAGWILALFAMLPPAVAVQKGFPPFPAAVLSVAALAWLTRGLHLDGVADLCDALGGGYDQEGRLAIMKDSSVGAFGVVALVVLLLLKSAVLTELFAGRASFLLLAAPLAASRWGMALLAWKSRYPRPHGTGHPFVGQVAGRDLFVGALLLIPCLAAGFPGLAAVAASLLPALWLRRKAHHSLGGVTGDVLGAAAELGEVTGWLMFFFRP